MNRPSFTEINPCCPAKRSFRNRRSIALFEANESGLGVKATQPSSADKAVGLRTASTTGRTRALIEEIFRKRHIPIHSSGDKVNRQVHGQSTAGDRSASVLRNRFA